eukprot:SM000003S11193  [mRNA]  locus=s3:1562809:1565228:+ [translate_table: standard]
MAAAGGPAGWWADAAQGVRVPPGRLWQEVSGSLGDLGTFLPLLLGLTVVSGLDLGTTLVATGAYNIATGFLFGLPMPVQPMKSIAAVALSEGEPLTVPQIMAAGMSTAAVMLVLSLAGLIDRAHRVLPHGVLRGIQLGLGVQLAVKGITLALHDGPTGRLRPWLGVDSLAVAAGAAALVALAGQVNAGCDEPAVGSSGQGRAPVPTAIVLLLGGLALAFATDPSVWRRLRLGPTAPHLIAISWQDLRVGFLRGAVPQIPLTLLNSVFAVCDLSNNLFPERRKCRPGIVAASVGVLNLCGCWAGAMPVCHGAGGLAAQYRFGARSGASVLFLGAGKALLGLTFGGSLLFPKSLLGVLLLFSGLELAVVALDLPSREDGMLAVLTAAASLPGKSTAGGFAAGMAMAMLLWLGRQCHDRECEVNSYERLPTSGSEGEAGHARASSLA